MNEASADIQTLMTGLGANARRASSLMAAAPTAAKNKALLVLARLLRESQAQLVAANARDLQQAASGLAEPLRDRLKLTPAIIETVAEGCEQIAAMPDPIGEITGLKFRPSGIQVGQMRVPLGVFGMIYESRPNVTIEAASLAIKSGNACILRGGSEALHSNMALIPAAIAASEEDWSTEYLAPIISIKVVDSLIEAIAHINQYGSHHTDAILTTNHPNAMRFLREVDSASVMINASTRFADGFEYGLGAEIGISTDKFHARGPVGLEGLTSMKWVVLGQGEVRS